jgi:hypothetical protein
MSGVDTMGRVWGRVLKCSVMVVSFGLARRPVNGARDFIAPRGRRPGFLAVHGVISPGRTDAQVTRIPRDTWLPHLVVAVVVLAFGVALGRQEVSAVGRT